MKIVQERVEKEDYLEMSLSLREHELLKEYMIISKKCYISGEMTNVGIKLQLGAEDDQE